MNSPLPEELIHERSHLLSLGEEQQVSPVDDVKPRMGNQARHDPGVDGWNDRVIVASQDQGRVTELMQPGQAGPTHACKQLPVVPETVRCSDQVRIRTSEVGPLPSPRLMATKTRVPLMLIVVFAALGWVSSIIS